MADVLKNLVILSLAGILALPGGWCCRPVQAQSSPVHEGRACCQHKKAASAPVVPARTPCSPNQLCCCCTRDWNAPGERVAVAPIDLALPVPLVAAVDVAAGLCCTSATAADLAAGPPLNILHCVWRC